MPRLQNICQTHVYRAIECNWECNRKSTISFQFSTLSICLLVIRQGGTFKEPDANNPKIKVNFPISFHTACHVVIVESSFSGDPKFLGTSVTAVYQDSFQYASGSYGGNAVRSIAFGV